MALSEEKKSHKQMRLLRLRFDERHKQFQEIKSTRSPLKREVEEFADDLIGLIDRACKNSGFKSQPVVALDNKGRVRKR